MPAVAAQRIIEGTLPPAPDLVDLADVVINLLANAQEDEEAQTGRDAADYFRAASTLEGDAVVAIVGGRGSGKTTLLTTVCTKLINGDKDIVLPIIRPESFRSTESLITVFASHLRELIEIGSKNPAAAEQVDVESTAILVQQVLRNAALAAPRTAEVLLGRQDSLSQYALDAVGLIRYSDQLVPSVRQLVARTRRLISPDTDCRIIVPLDDADLIPHRTAEILADLRTLGSLPNVVPIICVDRDDLHRHLEADLRRDYGPGLSDSHIADLARQQITKTILPSRSVAPPYMKVERRRDFAPLGEKRTVASLITSILQHLDPDGETYRGVLDHFQKASEPTAINRVTGAAWLPETPRELDNLWRVSLALESSLVAQDHRSAAPWLAKWLEEITANAPYQLRMDVERIDFAEGRLSIAATVAWSGGLQASLTTYGAWTSIVDDGIERVRLRRFARPTLSMLTEQSSRVEGKAAESERTVPSEATAAYLFVLDVLRLSAFVSPRPSGPTDFGSTDTYYLQTIEMVGQETDDLFFLAPISVGAVLVSRFGRLWNHLINDLPRGSGQLRTMACRYVSLIHRSWLMSEPPEDVTANTEEDLGSLVEAAGREYFRLQGEYDGVVRSDYTAVKAFCHWFEVALPNAFHELLVDPDLIEVVVSRWLRFIALSRRADEALDELRDMFRNRVAKNVTPASRVGNDGLWMVGYRVLLRQLDSELLENVNLHSAEYVKRISKSSYGRIATTQSVGLIHDSNAYDYDENLTPENIALQQLVMSVLDQLKRS